MLRCRAFIDNFVPEGSGGLAGPDVIAFGPDGSLYVDDQNSGLVKRYDGTTGQFIDNFITIPGPKGLAWRPGDAPTCAGFVSVGDTAVVEGDSGTKARFSLTLAKDGDKDVEVAFKTRPAPLTPARTTRKRKARSSSPRSRSRPRSMCKLRAMAKAR